MPPTASDTFLTKGEIARLAEVAPSAVANWTTRHPGFPEPENRSGTAYFPLPTVLDWLKSRRIQANYLRGDETAGTTYADRVRANLHLLGLQGRTVEAPPPPPSDPADQGDVDEVVPRLLDRYAPRAADRLPLPDYVLVLACLLAARHQPRAWSGISDWRRDAFRPSAEEMMQAIDRAARDLIADGVADPNPLLGGRELDGDLLSDLIDIVDRLPSDSLREVFNLLLLGFAKRVGRREGEQLTPWSITALAAALVVEDSSPDSVCDPYCRTGEFLSAVTEARTERGGPAPTVTASHPQGALVQLARLTLPLRGMRGRVRHGSTDPWRPSGGAPQRGADWGRFDAVLTNPPFNNRTANDPTLPETAAFPFGAPPAGDDNMAWVQYAAMLLAPEGRAVVVMPNAAASSAHPRNLAIRENLVRSGVVEAVIALPGQLFFGTNIAVDLWVLRSAHARQRLTEVLFIDASSYGRMVERTRRALTTEEVDEICGIYDGWRGAEHDGGSGLTSVPGVSTWATPEQIEAENWSLLPTTYIVPERRSSSNAPRVDAVKLAESVEQAAKAAVPSGLITRVTRSHDDQLLNAGGIPLGESVPLRELCEIQTGPSGATLKRHRSTSGAVDPESPVRLVPAKAIRELRIAYDATEALSRDLPSFMGRYRTQAGDLLMVRTGTLGRLALVEFGQEGWVINTNIIRLRATGDVDPGFLLGYLTHPDVQRWIARHTTSSTVPGISGQALGNLRVPNPPTDVQRRIGALMRGFEEQIQAQRDALQTAEQARSTLVESVFDLC